MSNMIWLPAMQMSRIEPYFPMRHQIILGFAVVVAAFRLP
jgi:hypothetical protein